MIRSSSASGGGGRGEYENCFEELEPVHDVNGAYVKYDEKDTSFDEDALWVFI